MRDEKFAFLLKTNDVIDYLVRLCSPEWDNVPHYRIRLLTLFSILRNRSVVPYTIERTNVLDLLALLLNEAAEANAQAASSSLLGSTNSAKTSQAGARGEECHFLAVCMLSAIADSEEGKQAVVKSFLWKLLVDLSAKSTENQRYEKISALANLIILNAYSPDRDPGAVALKSASNDDDLSPNSDVFSLRTGRSQKATVGRGRPILSPDLELPSILTTRGQETAHSQSSFASRKNGPDLGYSDDEDSIPVAPTLPTGRKQSFARVAPRRL
jgi:hypothetical protein